MLRVLFRSAAGSMGETTTSIAAPVRARAVLIIEDDVPIRRALRHALGTLADRLLEADTGDEGIALAAAQRPDLVILDLGLPDMAGVEVCREIRAWATMPIVVLSARHEETEKVELLNAGADDYVTKPFSPAELAARVHAQLRRRALGPERREMVITAGDLQIDLGRRTVTRAGRSVHLTPIEWDILRTLVGQSGRTLTHQQIFDAVWNRQFGNPQQYLRVYITNLRRKVEADPTHPRLIITEPGVGYRAEIPE